MFYTVHDLYLLSGYEGSPLYSTSRKTRSRVLLTTVAVESFKKRFRVPHLEHALPPKIDSREEIGYLIYVVGGAMIWYDNRNLSLNVNRTKEITVVFRRKHTVFTPLHLHGNTMQPARSTSSLGARMTDDLRCSTDTTSLVKRASQRTPFL